MLLRNCPRLKMFCGVKLIYCRRNIMFRFWFIVILSALLVGCVPVSDDTDPSPDWLEWEQNDNPRELERASD